MSVMSNDVLIDSDGQDSVLRICTPDDGQCRFVLLHKDVAGWTLVDRIEYPDERYVPPSVQIIPAGTRRWLVTRAYGGGGTGVALKNEDWFEVQCGRLVQLLSHVAWGYDVNVNPARHFSTRFVGYEKAGDTESLLFAYVVRFDNYEGEQRLWQEERRVVFSRKSGNTTFVYESRASELEPRWLERIFSFDSFDELDFLDFANERLLLIARDRSDRRRPWLQNFANKLPMTVRSRSLLSAITAVE